MGRRGRGAGGKGREGDEEFQRSLQSLEVQQDGCSASLDASDAHSQHTVAPLVVSSTNRCLIKFVR